MNQHIPIMNQHIPIINNDILINWKTGAAARPWAVRAWEDEPRLRADARQSRHAADADAHWASDRWFPKTWPLNV